jgi:hypothetical protein
MIKSDWDYRGLAAECYDLCSERNRSEIRPFFTIVSPRMAV